MKLYPYLIPGIVLAATTAHAYQPENNISPAEKTVRTQSLQLDEALQDGVTATRKAADTQVQINQLDDARVDMESEYRALLQRRDAAALYVRQQQRVVDIQTREIASLRSQLTKIDEIRVQMAPMMQDMQTALFAFRKVDLPFKIMTPAGIDVRATRYQQLQTLSERADISPGERYRLLLEAFQSEMEYGNVIDSYRDDITINGSSKTVDVFRFGRVAMVYLSEDRREAGRWNRQNKQWEILPSGYVEDFLRAIRIARNVAAPDILMGPVEKFSVE